MNRICTVSLLAVTVLALCAGCTSPRVSHTKRTAIEQRLLSASVDGAAAQMDTGFLVGKRIFIDESRFESEDKGYALSAIRNHLNRRSASIVSDVRDADAIVEVRCGALNTDGSDFLIGIPEIPIAVPGAGLIKTPQLTLLGRKAQSATAKLALFARDAKTGRHLGTVRPRLANRHYNRWTVFFIFDFTRTDLGPDSTQASAIERAANR